MQETKEAETLNGKNAAKASPPARAAGYEGRKIGWTRLLRHLFPHKVRRLLVEHDALEEMRSEVQWLRDHMERSLLLQGGWPPAQLQKAARSTLSPMPNSGASRNGARTESSSGW